MLRVGGGKEVGDNGERVSWLFLPASICLISCLPRVGASHWFLGLPRGIWLVYCCSVMVPVGEGGSRTCYFSLLWTLPLWNTIFSSYLRTFVHTVSSVGKEILYIFCQISKYPLRLYSDNTYSLTASQIYMSLMYFR